MARRSMQRDIVVKSVTVRLVKAKGIEKSSHLSPHKNIAAGERVVILSEMLFHSELGDFLDQLTAVGFKYLGPFATVVGS